MAASLPKKICIIGAGAAGLAALKNLKDSPQYEGGLWTPVVFEAMHDVGGVWLSGVYDSLTTNIPHPIMAYTDYSFPPSTPIFPPASVVRAYLKSYAEQFGLIPHIRFNTVVVSVKPQVLDSSAWKVTTSTGESFLFDFILVCNGKFREPRFPEVPGVETWFDKGKAGHSAWYKQPADFPNDSVILVVGNGPSGRDIAAELLSVHTSPSPVRRTIIHSRPGASNEDNGNLKIRGRTSRFDFDDNYDQGQVVFEDGTIEYGIDHCIFATGYQLCFPFLSDSVLRNALPPYETLPALPDNLYNTIDGVFPLARHIFPLRGNCNETRTEDSTLAFIIGLPVGIIAFPIFEAQARAIFHVFGNPDSFDCMQEHMDIIARYEHLLDEVGNNPSRIAEKWHVVTSQEQFDYRDQLNEFAKESFRVVKVEEWERLMFANDQMLRQVWRMLEKSGEAENWVKGVGENGKNEWVSVLERLLGRAREEGLPVIL